MPENLLGEIQLDILTILEHTIFFWTFNIVSAFLAIFAILMIISGALARPADLALGVVSAFLLRDGDAFSKEEKKDRSIFWGCILFVGVALVSILRITGKIPF